VTPPRDLFGRTENELVTAIARAEKTYAVSMAYSGNEGLAINHARMRANLDVDRGELRRLRGEVVPSNAYLTGAKLEQWRRDVLALGRHWGPVT
jgi:hypothetical protein